MQSLPLSWSLETNQIQNSFSANFLNDKLTWFSVCTFQKYSEFNDFISQNSSKQKQSLVIRGCNNNLATQLKTKGYSSIKVGMEAVLETDGNHFKKKSIKELVKRGLRHGRVIQLPYSKSNKLHLEKFKSETTHANEPQLENLFQTEFTMDNLLYIFVSTKSEWLGAVLVSKNGRQKLHTELILRTNNSPIGILESILSKIFDDAKNNNMLEMSLGEVPFITKKGSNVKSVASYLTIKLGRILKFAYSYDGLYNFKNKFQPRWDDLYVCSKPKIGFEHLVFLFIKSNFLKLVFYKIGIKLTKQNIIKKIQNNSKLLRPLLDFN